MIKALICEIKNCLRRMTTLKRRNPCASGNESFVKRQMQQIWELQGLVRAFLTQSRRIEHLEFASSQGRDFHQYYESNSRL